MKRLAAWVRGRWQKLVRSCRRRPNDADTHTRAHTYIQAQAQNTDRESESESTYAREAVERRGTQRRLAICYLGFSWMIAILTRPILANNWETAEIFTSTITHPFYMHTTGSRYVRREERKQLLSWIQGRCHAVLLVGYVEDGNVLAEWLLAAKIKEETKTRTEEWVRQCFDSLSAKALASRGGDYGLSKMTHLGWTDLRLTAVSARQRGEVIECC